MCSTSHSVDDIRRASAVPPGMKPAMSWPPTFSRYACRYSSAICARRPRSVTRSQRHDCWLEPLAACRPICRHSRISSRFTSALSSNDFRAERVVVRSCSTFTAYLISSLRRGLGKLDVRVVGHGADTKAVTDFEDLVHDRVGDEVRVSRGYFLEVR